MIVSPGVIVAVVVAGGLGAVVRHAASGARGPRAGMDLVNRIGSLLLGVLVGGAAAGAVPEVVLVVGAGFAGGLTTFSSLMVATAWGPDGPEALGRETAIGLVLAATGILAWQLLA